LVSFPYSLLAGPGISKSKVTLQPKYFTNICRNHS
jgi:hypothetical protein